MTIDEMFENKVKDVNGRTWIRISPGAYDSEVTKYMTGSFELTCKGRNGRYLHWERGNLWGGNELILPDGGHIIGPMSEEEWSAIELLVRYMMARRRPIENATKKLEEV